MLLNRNRVGLSCGRGTPPANRPLASISATQSNQGSRQIVQVAESTKSLSVPPEVVGPLAAVAGLGVAAYGLSRWLEAGSRPYSGNVGQEYDAWTQDGILERLVSPSLCPSPHFSFTLFSSPTVGRAHSSRVLHCRAKSGWIPQD